MAFSICVRFSPFFGWIFDAPERLEARAGRMILLDVLEAGELVGNGAHVATPLHVVLAAQRVAPASPSTDVPGQERQVDQREDVVDGVVVLGDAEGPADHRLVGGGQRVRRLANDVGGHAALRFGEFKRVRFDRRSIRLVALRRVLDELRVGQPGVDDLARHRIGERDVAPDVVPHPHVGPLGGRRPPGIHDVHARPVPHPLQKVMEPDGVRRTRVRSPEEDNVCFLDFAVGIC